MPNENVKVAVRVRPLNPSEIGSACEDSIRVISEKKIQIDHKGTTEEFKYDYVFGPNADQEEVFNTSVAAMIDHVIEGYNVIVLAYGQTGSGKTHTMGTAAQENVTSEGILPRVIHRIFERMLSPERDHSSHEIWVNFMELYKGELWDLLENKIRKEYPGQQGDEVRIVRSADEALRYLKLGSSRRITGKTEMNKQSSRSHAIFKISVRKFTRDPDTKIVSEFCLVDLAGSEKSQASKGEELEITRSINKNLFGLGMVVRHLILRTIGSRSQYVSYRSYALTSILKGSLDTQNPKILMLACLKPARNDSQESLATLKYAKDFARIRTKPIMNTVPQLPEGTSAITANELIHVMIHEIVGKINNERPMEDIEKGMQEAFILYSTLKSIHEEQTQSQDYEPPDDPEVQSIQQIDVDEAAGVQGAGSLALNSPDENKSPILNPRKRRSAMEPLQLKKQPQIMLGDQRELVDLVVNQQMQIKELREQLESIAKKKAKTASPKPSTSTYVSDDTLQSEVSVVDDYVEDPNWIETVDYLIPPSISQGPLRRSPRESKSPH